MLSVLALFVVVSCPPLPPQVEEYDVHTDQLLLRKLRHKSSLGAWGPWTFEVGEPVAKFNPNSDLMLESSNNVGSESTGPGGAQ